VTSEQWILRSHSQIPRHWKWEFSARVSQKFRQTYISHLINSCCLRWRILHSGVCPSVETHWSTATIYSLGFDRLTLPSLKDEGILELILIYRTWVSEFQTGSVRRILNCFLSQMSSRLTMLLYWIIPVHEHCTVLGLFDSSSSYVLFSKIFIYD